MPTEEELDLVKFALSQLGGRLDETEHVLDDARRQYAVLSRTLEAVTVATERAPKPKPAAPPATAHQGGQVVTMRRRSTDKGRRGRRATPEPPYPAPPKFEPDESISAAIRGYVAASGRTWQLYELIHLLVEESNLGEVTDSPESIVAQALARGVKSGQIRKTGYGQYGPG